MRIFPVLLLVSIFALSCGNPAKDAVSFNDNLVDLANQCIRKKDALTQTVNQGNCAKADSALKELAASAKHALDSLQLLTPGEAPEDKNFYDAAQKYYSTIGDLAANEFAEFCRLYCEPDSLFTENDQLRHAELAKTINAKDSAADAAFEMAQKRFATKHQINIR